MAAPVPRLSGLYLYAFIVAGSVGSISEVWSDLQRVFAATERLVELLESPSDIEDGPIETLPPIQALDLTVKMSDSDIPAGQINSC